MNKKGFTLIELLAVIVIISLISLVAIPNIVGLQDGIKKDQMLDDAKKLISMAKYVVTTDYDVKYFQKTENNICVQGVSCTLPLSLLNTSGDISQDPDSTSNPPSNYIAGSVKYTIVNNTVKYCVYLEGIKRRIGTSANDCILEENLYSRSNVVDK